MTDFYQNGTITTLHHLRNRSLDDLEKELKRLQKKLRSETHKKYGRVNPFIEDITDWKERGEFLFGKGKNITVYNSFCDHRIRSYKTVVSNYNLPILMGHFSP